MLDSSCTFLWKNHALCIMLIYEEASRSCFRPAIDRVQARWQRRDAALQRQPVATQGDHSSQHPLLCTGRALFLLSLCATDRLSHGGESSTRRGTSQTRMKNKGVYDP